MSNNSRKGRGLLIAIEGIDGSGKSTLASLLHKALQHSGWDALLTHEPTRGRYGQAIRRTSSATRLDLATEFALFLADRADHVNKCLAPALRLGKIVIADRYYFSSVAYQGARGLDPRLILGINTALFPRPDVAILVDVEPHTAKARMRSRRRALDSFDRASGRPDVADVFRRIPRTLLHRIDGQLPPEEILRAAMKWVKPAIARRTLTVSRSHALVHEGG